MKKFFKILAVALSVLLLALLALLLYLNKRPAAPADYQSTVPIGGALEAKYMAKGDFTVSRYEEPVPQGFEKFILYYPTALTEGTDTYPVIVLCNGSGTPLSKYPAVAEHFASWGFLVIGTEEQYDWNGFSAEMCLRYPELLNENEIVNEKANIFCGKIGLANVGIVGHSQGAVGVINAVTAQPHGSLFKATVALSPTNKELAHNLLWDYDATKITVPTLLMAGAGGGDDWVVTGEQLEEIYNDIPAEKVMLRRTDTPHNEMLYSANGYVTAWFCHYLQGDTAAAKLFWDENSELFRNPLYQDGTSSPAAR